MKRQLYYLLPNILHTKEICNELNELHISESDIHAVVNKKTEIEGVNDIHSLSEPDHDSIFESHLWQLNLILFAVAFVAFISMLVLQSTFYIALPIVAMIATLSAGFYFVMNFPNAHWSEFYDAVHHGEILLIVDVPKKSMSYVDHVLHEHHPELISGGACWKI